MNRIGLKIGHQWDVKVRVKCPYDSTKEFSWDQLHEIERQDDVRRKKALTAALCDVFCEISANEAYAPFVKPGCTEIIDARVLRTRIHLDSERHLHRGSIAGGMFLNENETFITSALNLDCSIIIAVAGQHMIVAYAGCNSLVNAQRVLGKTTLQPISIVDSIIESFEKHEVSRDEIEMRMLFGNSRFPIPFKHPHYGEYNEALAKFVESRWPGVFGENGTQFINLESVFRKQTEENGIQNQKVSATDSLEEHPILERNKKEDNGKESKDKSNLIVVKRCKAA